MKKVALFVFFIVTRSFLSVAGGYPAAPIKPTKLDTSTNNYSAELVKQLTVNDSIALFPAYDMYCQWDTTDIHPYGFTFFRDSVDVALADAYSSQFVIPHPGKVNSNFGPRRRQAHFGIDIDLEVGDTVLAAFDGMVRISKKNKSYGNVVVIRHKNGMETLYAHLSKLLVQPGQIIKAGEVLGLGGNTGRSTGAHLHFETRYMGLPINPNDIISFEEKRLMMDTIQLSSKSFEYYELCKTKKYTYTATKGKKGSYKKVSVHTIRKGDTLYNIAKRYHLTTAQLCKLNRLKTTSVLKVGTKLRCG